MLHHKLIYLVDRPLRIVWQLRVWRVARKSWALLRDRLLLLGGTSKCWGSWLQERQRL